MAAVIPTLLRGALGVVASVFIVAVTWTLYINRADLIDAGEPVMEMISNASQDDVAAPVDNAGPTETDPPLSETLEKGATPEKGS